MWKFARRVRELFTHNGCNYSVFLGDSITAAMSCQSMIYSESQEQEMKKKEKIMREELEQVKKEGITRYKSEPEQEENKKCKEYGFSMMAKLEFDYINRSKLINHGYGGITSGGLLKRLNQGLLRHIEQITTLVIMLGSNDADSGLEGKKLEDAVKAYSENLRHIIEHRDIKRHSPHILLVTPPPVWDDDIKIHNNLATKDLEKKLRLYTRSSRMVEIFAAECRRLGKSLGVDVLDIHQITSERIKQDGTLHKLWFRDGLHFLCRWYEDVYWPEVDAWIKPKLKDCNYIVDKDKDARGSTLGHTK